VKAEFKYINTSGTVCDGYLHMEDYKLAASYGMSVNQLINARFSDADVNKYGTAFEQGCQNLGIYTKPDPVHGIRVSKVAAVLSRRPNKGQPPPVVFSSRRSYCNF